MIRILPVLLFFCWYCNDALGQQSPQYSLYMHNMLPINPAFAGLESSLSITGVFRKQWVNLDGSPSQQSVNAHMPVYIASSGIGFSFENDQLGARNYSRFQVHGAYHLPISSRSILSLGANVSFGQFSWDGSALRTPGGQYGGGVDHGEASLPTSSVSAGINDFGVGLVLSNDQFKAGISARNIANNNIVLENISLEGNREYFAFLKYKFGINDYLEVEPSTLIKYDINEWQAEVSAILTYNGNIFGGIGYRGVTQTTQDALVWVAGLRINDQFRLWYAYDMSLSPLQEVQAGSHEIVLNYLLGKEIGKGKLPKVIYNPRFL